MTEPARKIATYDDLFSIPENMIGEIIDGELLASPRPAVEHAFAASNLGGVILPPFRFGQGGPGGWIILYEPEIAFGEDIIVPDLAGWKSERFSIPRAHNWISVSPDWVCEVLSPSTFRKDKIKKMPIFARHGVPHLWLIDPSMKTLDVYQLETRKWMLVGVYAENEKVRAEPFQEIEIDLGLLWLIEKADGHPAP